MKIGWLIVGDVELDVGDIIMSLSRVVFHFHGYKIVGDIRCRDERELNVRSMMRFLP